MLELIGFLIDLLYERLERKPPSWHSPSTSSDVMKGLTEIFHEIFWAIIAYKSSSGVGA